MIRTVVSGIPEFQEELKASEQKLLDAYLRIRARIAMEMLRVLVFTTRVRTGRARGNWQLSTGGPILSEVARTFSKVPVGGGEAVSIGGEVMAAGQSALAGDRIMLGTMRFTSIYFTNNLPYVEGLNAKDHMMERAIAHAESMFEGREAA